MVDLLTSRVNELTQFIIDQGFTPPPALDDNEATLKNALDTLGLHHIQMSLEGAERKEVSHKQIKVAGADKTVSNDDAAAENLDIGELGPNMSLPLELSMILEDNHPYEAQSEAVPSLESVCDNSIQPYWDGESAVPDEDHNKQHSSSPEQHLRPPPPSDNESRKDENLPQLDLNDGTEDIVDRLSDRMGSLQIGSDGQIRYYGPTSHFNLLQMPTPDNLTICRTIRKDGQDHLNRMGLDREVPQSMEEHLINLYFTWHNPSVDVVNRDMYEMAKQQWKEQMEDTPYYSEALTNAM